MVETLAVEEVAEANMNTFETTVKKGVPFFYKRGAVSTTKIWNRPTYSTMKTFFERVKDESTILSDYEVYIMGGVLYSFDNTWDIDICLTGKISSCNKLEEQMNFMYDLALNQLELLIDVQWLDRPLPEISFQELISPTFRNYKLKFIKTAPIIKKIGDDETIWDLRKEEGVTRLSENLIEGYHEEYPITKKKILERIIGNPDKVLKSVMRVEEFLNNDETYFLNNTNRF